MRAGSAAALAAALAALGALPPAARAGPLAREDLARWFPAPLLVGERDASLPVWPIFRQNGPPAFTTDLVGYAFASADLAPIPGFAGTPIDLLVALDTAGAFLDVRVLSQHEPVFVGGLGEEPLRRFVSQYRGLDLRQPIRIGGPREGAAARSGGAPVRLDGIAKATASLRIVNQSVLAAALRVARAKLGFAGGDPDLVARVRTDRFEPRSWRELVDAGLVRQLTLRNLDVERAFAGSEVAGVDPAAASRPFAPFMEVFAALATVPSAGRNLLDREGWRTLTARINPGDHVLLVMSRGGPGIVDEDSVRGSVPDRLSLSQGGLAIELRDLDLDPASLRPSGGPALDTWRAFRVIAQAGLDPGAPFELSVRVTRARGMVYPERVGRDFALACSVPDEFLVAPGDDQKGSWSAWRARPGEIGVLAAALALLAWALARRSPLVARARALRWSRPAFLAFTLGFVGWYAQGQLSIVNVVALAQAAVAGRSWAFFLHDPMTTILWIFVLATLAVWGRGTFCGWLCPFGALQELVARIARLARVPALRVPDRLDRRLKLAKYAVLVAVVVAGLSSPRWGDAALEVEPFKTAITLGFARPWPFAAWAAAAVLAGVAVERAFCRYACPLGAWLAFLGALPRLGWIPRRSECGAPCQVCRRRCEVQAIGADGRVDYRECFQCMDCVAVYHDDALCAPRAAALRARRAAALPARAQDRSDDAA